MTENKKSTVDTETLLFALDQIGQTVGIINSVVNRLKDHVIEHQQDELASQKNRSQSTNHHHSDNTNTLH